MSSPPVRMLAVPQAVSSMARGQSPWSCRCFSIRRFADFQPSAQAVGVGTARLSTEKKLRPVGRTSGRPRVGAPDGPGATRGRRQGGEKARRFRPGRRRDERGEIGLDGSSTGRMGRSHEQARTCIGGASKCVDPSRAISAQAARSSSRSTVSPVLRHGSALISARGRGAGQPTARPCRNRAGRSRALPPEIRGQRARQRGIAGGLSGRRRADSGPSAMARSRSSRPSGRAAEDVQAVADLRLLQLAEIGVELGEIGVLVLAGHAASASSPVASVSDRISRRRCRCGGGRRRRPRNTRRPAPRDRAAGRRFRRGSAAG
jgi:hypothetical protein